ncbi:MAG: carbon-nitrogen hydrolase [Nitrospiraceae bacterium]
MGDANMKTLALGLVQMRMAADPDQNLESAMKSIRQAAKSGAQVVCLPELFRTHYFCQSQEPEKFDLAEPVPGPTTETLAALAKELGVVIVLSVFERRTEGIYHNTAVVLDANGAICGVYRKMHIPDDPLYYEKYYFTPGDLGFQAFNTRFGKVGALVCWDQWFPEAARLTTLQGAQLLVYPTAIGWHPSEKARFGKEQISAWQTIQRSHAIANGVFVVAVNRVGHEGPEDGGLEFWGHSFVADPFGVVLAEAISEGPEVLVVECELARLADVRRNWPFLRDRRIDAYTALTQRAIDRR